MRIEVSKEHARNLALVHKVDWRAAGFDAKLPVPENATHAARDFIDSIAAQLELRLEPIPLFLAGAAWLKARAPVAPCLSLCKGTNGLGEEVFLNGKVVAMSDWEEASIGDPASTSRSRRTSSPSSNATGARSGVSSMRLTTTTA